MSSICRAHGFAAAAQACEFLLGVAAHIGVALGGQERFRLGNLLIQPLKGLVRLDEFGQAAVFLDHARKASLIGDHRRFGHESLQFLVALDGLGQ